MIAMTVCKRIFVTGRVQGVFFRQTLKVTAKKNDVCGWVKNLDDGRVEAILEGKNTDVAKVIDWARVGPANSRVVNVEIQEMMPMKFSKFDVHYL